MLFIIYSETLSKIVGKEELADNFHRIKVAKGALAISHLKNANDLLITFLARRKKAKVFHKCFELYCSWSGQDMNKEKSSIFFSKNTARAEKRHVTNLLGIKEMGHSSIYKGNSLIISRNRSKEFRLLKERMQKRLESWSGKLLSEVGISTFIKLVVQAISSYSMTNFKVPLRVYKEMDRMATKLWSASNLSRFHISSLEGLRGYMQTQKPWRFWFPDLF